MVGKSVPKTAFYCNLEVNARVKQRFVDDVTGITWVAKVAPSTLNVADGKAVHEIAALRMELINRSKIQRNNDFFGACQIRIGNFNPREL